MRTRLLNIVYFVAAFTVAFSSSSLSLYDGTSTLQLMQHVYAQDKQTAKEEKSEAENKADVLARAQADALKGQMRSVMQSLDQGELTHFNIIQTNYTIYSLVKAVRDDVNWAVDACVENNPDMKTQLQARWDKWDKSVSENMKEAMSNINAMSMAQDYVSQDKLKRIFSLIDKTRAVNSSRFEKIPVTTPEACEFMISKMSETEDNMNMMLVSTLNSYPSVMKRMQE
ncbi:MAG: hypothetical protein KAJ40_04280 [Alphaproteobacteria bacterium]|nr:hypothetical protein [Alphaproteobacteria bacterium]